MLQSSFTIPARLRSEGARFQTWPRLYILPCARPGTLRLDKD